MEVLDTAAVLVAAVLGLCVGSFLNVVVSRVPEGRSVATPRSSCPSCGTPIRPYDLVPVVSWLLLRGRCRSCNDPISATYPLVEAGTAAVWALVAWRIGWDALLPASLVWSAGLLALSVIDLRTFRLPTKIIYATLAVTSAMLVLAAAVTGHWGQLVQCAAGAVIAFGVYLLIHVAQPKGMGFGDVRLSALIGAMLGWHGLAVMFVGLFLGFLIGAAASVVVVAAKRGTLKTKVPFGPYMCVGAMTALLYGREIVDWWLPAY